MSWFADVALWTALVMAGLATGLLASQWHGRAAAPRADLLMMMAAGSAVVAWSARAGALLGSGPPPPLFTALVPVDVGPAYRFAVLWATLPGGALTIGAALMVSAALAPQALRGTRAATVLSALGVMGLAVATWFAPTAQSVAPTALPPFVQAPAAAAAPLFALAALVALAWHVGATLATDQPMRPRGVLLAAWLSASVAVAAEQLARSQLGIGPRDGVVLGTASSGLLLWLAISALLHHRVQQLLRRNVEAPVGAPLRRLGTRLGHVGAILLVASFAAHVAARRSTVDLPPGRATEIVGAFGGTWRLVNQGVSRFDAEGVDVTALAVEVTGPGGATALVSPELRDWHARDGAHLERPVGLRRSMRSLPEELRVLLEGTDSVDVARVRVTFIPVPLLWPAGLLLLGAAAAALAAARNEPAPSQ